MSEKKSRVFYTVFRVFRRYLVWSHFYLFCWPKRVDPGSSQETIMEEWILFQPLSRLQSLVQKVDLHHATLTEHEVMFSGQYQAAFGLENYSKIDKINKGILKSTYKERKKTKTKKKIQTVTASAEVEILKKTQTSNPATVSQRPEEPVSKTTADVCVWRDASLLYSWSRLTWH